MSFLVLGDANADLNATLEHFPHEGDDSPIQALNWTSGGSAANVATALALLGAPVRLLARTGRDPAANVALRAARCAGVDLRFAQEDDALATGLCFAAVSPSGERSFFSYRGANTALTLPDRCALFHDVVWLHVAGHALLEGSQRQTTLALLDEAEGRGIPISLDLCLPLIRQSDETIRGLLPRLELLFANHHELGALAPAEPPETTLAQLKELGVPLIAAKLGARGCRIRGRAHCDIPAFEVDARDTTGAGDAFVAGFLLAVQRGESPELAGTLGNALGALSATRSGAAEALPSRAELEAFLDSRGARSALSLWSQTHEETRS